MNGGNRGRIVLIDPDQATRATFAERLRAQDFTVDEAADGVSGAANALGAPPVAVVADLWMPGVSGVQLCRLLKAEPATADVPVVLRADTEDPSSRFWATRAGAAALVSKSRMGDLVRALFEVTNRPTVSADFFFQLNDDALDIRDRIAQHLDRALFESVVAAEVRALSSAASFPRLFDSLSQLVAQLVEYRWLSVVTTQPVAFAIHTNGRIEAAAVAEAKKVLAVADATPAQTVLDADASDAVETGRTIVSEILLGNTCVGRIAVNTVVVDSKADTLVPLIARELGPAIRLATLLEESRRLATTDGLTNLYNRRAFTEILERECARCDRCNGSVSLLLLDLDHFKIVNDTHGHAAGDAVLSAVSSMLKSQGRAYDVMARWGGEEFVVALPDTPVDTGLRVAERIRAAVAELVVLNADGVRIPLSASIGVAERTPGETIESAIDRADRAMYRAKTGGRNRVCGEAVAPVSIEAVPARAA